MSFLSLLLALLIEQARPLMRGNWVHRTVRAWVSWISQTLDAGHPRLAWTTWCLAVGVPAVIATVVHWTLIALFGWPVAMIWSICVLYATLGFRQFSHHFTDIRDALDVGDERLAPAGAVVYRMSQMVSLAWQASPKTSKGWVSDTLQDAARHAWHRVDWLPARLTAVAFAVVGNFEEAIDCWRNHAQRFPDDNDGVVLSATAGALNVRLGGEALRADTADDVRDSESTPGRTPELAHLSSVVGLVWRSVVLWMVLLALLTLARLLG